MSATIVVTATESDSLIETAGAVGWDAERLDGGRVRIQSSIPSDTPEGLAADVTALGNRFGVTAWEPAI